MIGNDRNHTTVYLVRLCLCFAVSQLAAIVLSAS